ncbi:ARL14 effector protein isoform X1 [Embiotoca jacksoni]|uniref:ARL14 effector protein isoform X1 n=1 Tax=Embiotoca jacksoni TaxID=100190 RepID=UPI00370454DC
MPVICAATGCNNKFVKGSEIRFYRFPLSKPQLAGKWVNSLGMKNFIPTTNTCLCSEHFRTDCFRDYNGKQFLREDAVPTIFTQDSSKIELRKRGVIPKETNVVPQLATQADRDRAREAVLRRDKRGGMRGGRGGRGGKQLSDRPSEPKAECTTTKAGCSPTARTCATVWTWTAWDASTRAPSADRASAAWSAAATGSGCTSRWRWRGEKSSGTSLLSSFQRIFSMLNQMVSGGFWEVKRPLRGFGCKSDRRRIQDGDAFKEIFHNNNEYLSEIGRNSVLKICVCISFRFFLVFFPVPINVNKCFLDF